MLGEKDVPPGLGLTAIGKITTCTTARRYTQNTEKKSRLARLRFRRHTKGSSAARMPAPSSQPNKPNRIIMGLHVDGFNLEKSPVSRHERAAAHDALERSIVLRMYFFSFSPRSSAFTKVSMMTCPIFELGVAGFGFTDFIFPFRYCVRV